MKSIIYIAPAVGLLALAGCSQDGADQAEEEAQLDSLNEKVSYVLGLNIGQQFRSQQVELDLEALGQAIEDVYADREPRLSDQEMQTAMETFQQQHQERMAAQEEEQAAEQENAAAENKEEGETFLAENADKEGVETLPSGLQYKQIEAGEGTQPGAEDTVTVHYRGTLLDGTEFDSSYERGEPATFPLQNVIPGWTEGLQQMREGSKYELYIPSELAYGPGGSPPQIGPNATLIFEVELVEVEEADQEEASTQ